MRTSRSRVFMAAFWLLGVFLPELLSAQVSEKPSAPPQTVDLGACQVTVPAEGKWKVEVDKDKGQAVFTRTKGTGVLNVLSPTSQARETVIVVDAFTLPPWRWAVDEAQAAALFITQYAKELSYPLRGKGDKELNGKKLKFAKFSDVVRPNNDPAAEFSQDYCVYFYCPPDFKRTHRYFQFQLIFSRAAAGIKLYQNPGEEPVLAVIDSLKIKDPIQAAAGPDGDLVRAAVAGDLEAMKQALEKGAKLEAAAPQLTALGAAALYGHREIVEFLLGQGAAVDTTDMEGGRTPLHQALIGGAAEIAGVLLQAGADADARTLAGFSPLMYASVYGYEELVSALLERGADINARTNDGDSALIFAAQSGPLGMARLLMDKEADLNAQDNNGWTALMRALDEKHLDIARSLLERGADVKPKSVTGWSALMEAVEAESPDIVRALIQKGADINSRTKDNGWTPLLFALSIERADVVAKILIDAGADVKAKLDSGRTTLMFAAGNASAETVKLLIEKGADINAKFKKRYTALSFASALDRSDIVQILKAAGAKK